MVPMKSHEWARIAAWIETEGCILAVRSKRAKHTYSRYRARVQIGQKHKEPLEWIQERVGGSLRQDQKGTYRLILSYTVAYQVLRKCMPYFIHPNKKRQAKLAVELSWPRTTNERSTEIHKELQRVKRLR